jgi:hypothetical protein
MPMMSSSVLLGLMAMLGQAPVADGEDVIVRCPLRGEARLSQAQLFDGPVTDQAILQPEEAGDATGTWEVAYVYAAGRTLHLQCQYADGVVQTHEISGSLTECKGRIDAVSGFVLDCR